LPESSEVSNGVATVAFSACGGRNEAAVLVHSEWQERMVTLVDLDEEEGG